MAENKSNLTLKVPVEQVKDTHIRPTKASTESVAEPAVPVEAAYYN